MQLHAQIYGKYNQWCYFDLAIYGRFVVQMNKIHEYNDPM
jgi:hypothetical protein